MMITSCCGKRVRNVPLVVMRKIGKQEVVLGRALSGERPGQDRRVPIHGGLRHDTPPRPTQSVRLLIS